MALGESPPDAPDALSFTDLVRVFWQHRWLLLAGFLAGGAIAAAVVFSVGVRYRSTAVVELPYIAFSDFKRYATAITDRDRFLAYAGNDKSFTADELQRVRDEVTYAGVLAKWIRPSFAATKTDVKDLTEAPKDASQFVGVEIDVSAATPELAAKIARVSGMYARDVVIDGKITDYVLRGLLENTSELARQESRLLANTFELQQLERKRDELKTMAQRYADVGKDGNRQLISLDVMGSRFLSPTTQVIGAESEIADTKDKLARAARKKESLEIQVDFFRAARAELTPQTTGGELVAALSRTFAGLQRRLDPNKDVVRETLALIRVEVDQIVSLYNDHFRFSSPPTTERLSRILRVWSPILVSATLGLLLCMVFALVHVWWSRNREAVLRGR